MARVDALVKAQVDVIVIDSAHGHSANIIRALKEIKYAGACGLELRNAYLQPSEMNPGADPAWIPRSIGYFRGLMASI